MLDPAARTEADPLVTGRFEEHGDRNEVRAVSFTDTGVVRDAGEAVFSDPHRQGAVVALWRQLSGDAHGLLWTTMTRASTVRSLMGRDPRYPLPMTQMASGGPPRNSGRVLGVLPHSEGGLGAFRSALHLALRHWDQRDQRRLRIQCRASHLYSKWMADQLPLTTASIRIGRRTHA